MVLDPNAPDAGAVPLPAGARGGVQVVDLGNGYSFVTYTDPTGQTPPFQQIVSNKSLTGGGTDNSLGWAQLANSKENQAASLTEQQRQFDQQLAFNRAQYNTTVSGHDALGNPTLSAEQLLGSINGQPTLDAQRLGLDKQNANFNYYQYLNNLASNPRNFVENFFARRGAGVPAGASQFGTQLRPGDVGSFSQFMGGNTGFNQQVAPAQSAPTTQAPAQNTQSTYDPNTDPYKGTMYAGLSGFNPDGTLRLAPNDPNAETLMAKHPGQYRIGYSQGGVMHEPIVGRGLVSGQTYTFNEHGPEGIVPTKYLPDLLKRRHGQIQSPDSQDRNGLQYPSADFLRSVMMGGGGSMSRFGDATIGADPSANDYGFSGVTRSYAVGGDLGYANTTDPYNVNYAGPIAPDPNQLPDYGAVSPISTGITTQDTSALYPTTGLTSGTTDLTGTVTAPSYTQTPAPAGFHWAGNVLVQDQTTNTITSPTTNTTGGTPAPLFGGGSQIAPTLAPTSQPAPQTAPQATVVTQPQGAGTYAPPPAGTPTPLATSPIGTFGQGAGRMPSFLPGEDTGGQSTLQALTSAGYVPPFLTRSLAQARGIQSQGTNQPNAFNLPADVPLLSKLAWTQLSPDEQQAYLSYASSYGVTPEEYLNAIDAFSPQGGVAPWSPTFGSNIPFIRQ